MWTNEMKPDRRKYLRVPLQARCTLSVTPVEALKMFAGVTENLSRRGVLIRCKVGPEAGQLPGLGNSVMLALEWPARDPSGPTYLQGWGRVVRVSEAAENQAVLVAVELLRMALWSARESAALEMGAAAWQPRPSVVGEAERPARRSPRRAARVKRSPFTATDLKGLMGVGARETIPG